MPYCDSAAAHESEAPSERTREQQPAGGDGDDRDNDPSALEQQYDELFDAYESQKEELARTSKRAKSLAAQLAKEQAQPQAEAADHAKSERELSALRRRLQAAEKDLGCACWMAKNRYGGFMGPFAMLEKDEE